VWSASRPGRLYPRKRPGTHCTGVWVEPGASLDRCGKSRPTGVRSPDLPTRSESLHRLRYSGSRQKSTLFLNSCVHIQFLVDLPNFEVMAPDFSHLVNEVNIVQCKGYLMRLLGCEFVLSSCRFSVLVFK
jgi:hypothetical protein